MICYELAASEQDHLNHLQLIYYSCVFLHLLNSKRLYFDFHITHGDVSESFVVCMGRGAGGGEMILRDFAKNKPQVSYNKCTYSRLTFAQAQLGFAPMPQSNGGKWMDGVLA